MGLNNRPYYHDSYGQGHGRSAGFGGWVLPPLTPALKFLLVANFAAFILQVIGWNAAGSRFGFMELWFAALSDRPLEVWRLLTFQFLHGSAIHLLFNMIGLYFLGSTIERRWGSRQFLGLYLSAGIVGGLVFLVGSQINPGFFGGTLVGASGGVLGMLAVAAIAFPHFVVFVFLFPVPIRWAAVGFTVLYILNVISGGANAGGDLAHLGGMATGVVWLLGRPALERWWNARQGGTWQKKLEHEQKLQFEVDRILAKVREQGIASLSRREKSILQKATEAQRRRDTHTNARNG